MKDILLISIYIVSSLEFLFGLYLLKTQSGSNVRKMASAIALTISIWVLLNAFVSYRDSSHTVLVFTQILYFVATLMIIEILHLSLIYPLPLFRLDRVLAFLLYVPLGLFTFLFFRTDQIIRNIVINRNIPGYIIPGESYQLFNGFVSLVFFLVILILLLQIKRSYGHWRKTTIILALGVFFPGLMTLILNVWNQASWINYNTLIAPILSIIWLFLMAYIALPELFNKNES